MLATILFRIFCLPVSSQKNLNIKIYKATVYPLFCMGVKLALSPLREELRLRVCGKGC
jgi:hypothetical protein